MPKKGEIIDYGFRAATGCDGDYLVNPLGQVVRDFKNGRRHLLVPHLHHNRWVVKVRSRGAWRPVPVATIVLEAFRGPRAPGMVPHHKNGIKSDNRLDNLAYITSEELGRKTGRLSKGRPVLKIDRSGDAVATYRSASEAGRLNHLSRQAVTDRCNGRIKRPYELDGCTYAWED